MLASWQSSQQQNIVKNNVDSSINNSVANLSSNTIDFNIYDGAESMITAGRDVTIKNCDASLRADINTNMTADIRSISKTDTQFDNTIGVNISNDLKNDTKQETPGMGGGFLSAQINNQLNEVSNNVSNQISNNVYIDRTNRINTVSEKLAKSGVDAGRDFLCENSSLDFSSNVGESTAMDIFTDTDDKLVIKNDIHVALTNKLSNKVEQGGSIGMAIIMCVFLVIVFGKTASSHGGGSGSKSTTVILWIAGFIWITWVGILANTEWILTDDEKYEFRKKTFWNLGYGGSVCGDSELALDENSILSEEDCIKFYKDIHFWDKTWSDKTIRNKIKIEDGYGETMDYKNLKRDIYSPTPCPPDFSGPLDKCRTKGEDFKYELLLKRAFSCVNENEDHITQDMLSYHHELYSSGGPLYESPNTKIRNLSGSSQPIDMSVDIIQPGTGYLTGGPYKTSCKRVINGETKSCCKDDSTGCIDLQVNVKSIDSCSSSDIAIKNDDMTDGGESNKGYGCYQKSDGNSKWSESTSLSEYLFGDILWNTNGAIPCNYTGVVSGLKGFIEGGLGVCADTQDTEGNDVSCVKGDKCFINYKTEQQRKDSEAGTEDVNLDSSFIQQYCPKEVLVQAGPNIGCIFEVGGVEQIKIKNASEAEDSGHVIHPDNIYTIDSGKDNSDSSLRKALWADGTRPEFDVRYLRNKLVNPPPAAPGSAPLPPEDGIWATSELLITTNSNNYSTNYASNKTEGDEICKTEKNEILSNRAWPGMENICEPKFKLMPLLSRTSSSPGSYITDSASRDRTLGCKNSMDLSGGDGDMDKLKQCRCVGGTDMDLEYSYTSTYLGYIIVPLIIILLIVAVLSFMLGGKTDSKKDTGDEIENVTNLIADGEAVDTK